MPEIGPADIWFDPRKILPAAKNALMYPVTHPAQTAEFGLSVAPGSGEAMAGVDAWDASGRASNALLSGNYGQAASEYGNMGAALLGAIPGAGVIARGTKRGAAWMDRNLPAGVNRLLDAAMPSDPQNTLNAIPAWHGSPHDFEQFSMEHIGKGEGAQAYGHGLYFAEHPDVAKEYREALGTARNSMLVGDKHYSFSDAQKLADDYNIPTETAYQVLAPFGVGRAPDQLPVDFLQARLTRPFADTKEAPAINQAIEFHQQHTPQQGGRLYHAELDVEPHDLLDWDKPLSQQSEKVRAIIKAKAQEHGAAPTVQIPTRQYEEQFVNPLVDALPRPFNSRVYAEKALSGNFDALAATKEIAPENLAVVQGILDRHHIAKHDAPGQAWWEAFVGDGERDPVAASAALRDAGIPGIKYLDQGSRGAEGAKSHNFVIFDDKLVKVLKKE